MEDIKRSPLEVLDQRFGVSFVFTVKCHSPTRSPNLNPRARQVRLTDEHNYQLTEPRIRFEIAGVDNNHEDYVGATCSAAGNAMPLVQENSSYAFEDALI